MKNEKKNPQPETKNLEVKVERKKVQTNVKAGAMARHNGGGFTSWCAE
jgi:hypothetical protein